MKTTKSIPFTHRLKVRMMLTITLLFILLITAISSFLYWQSHQMILDNITSEALMIANTVAEKVDASALQGMQTPEDSAQPAYQELGNQLQNIMSITGVKYLYIIRETEDGLVYLIEGEDFGSEEATSIGEPVELVYEGYELALDGIASEDKEISVDEDGALLSAYAPLMVEGQVVAMVGVDYDASSEYEAFEAFKRTILLTAIIALLLAGGITYLIATSLTKGILKLTQASSALSQGDFTAEAISFESKTELGLLVSSYNAMNQNIRQLIISIRDAVKVLEGTSHSLQASTTDLANSGDEIAKAVTHVASGAEQQVAETHKGLSTLDELTKLVESMLSKLSHALTRAEDMRERNAAGLSAMTSLNQIFQEDRLVRNKVNEVIKALSEKSNAVGEIALTIDEISGQTNLLALNANIEAARAGEHGKGFAVVAEEVRKLAEQSAASSGVIRTTINEIMTLIDGVHDTMKSSNAVSETALDQLGDTAKVFEKLSQSIDEVSVELTYLETDISKVHEAEKSTSLAINHIAKVANITAGSMQEISAAVEEETSHIDMVADTTSDLDELIKDLSRAIDTYKI